MSSGSSISGKTKEVHAFRYEMSKANEEIAKARENFSELEKNSGFAKIAMKEFPALMNAFGDKTLDARKKAQMLRDTIQDVSERIKDTKKTISDTKKGISELISGIESEHPGLKYKGSISDPDKLNDFLGEYYSKLVDELVDGYTGTTATPPSTPSVGTTTAASSAGSGPTGTSSAPSSPSTPSAGTTTSPKISPEDLKKIDELKEGLESGRKNIDDIVKLFSEIGIEVDSIGKDLQRCEDLEKGINKLGKEQLQLKREEAEYINRNTELYEAGTEQMRAGIAEVKNGFGVLVKFGKEFLGTWGKIDQAASKFAKSIGAGAHGMAAMRKSAIDMVARGSFAGKYNVSADELMGMASSYRAQIGRNIALSEGDYREIAATSAVFGDKAQATRMFADLQNYGYSMEKSAQVAGRMFQEAGKYGVSFEKYSKNFMNNIKVAQAYSFRNGVRDLEAMARKATEIKLDMQQVVRLADKLSEGGIQAAVETGANLQVLGGPFAQFSDPLQMLNEGLNDPKALMDRFVGMTKGLGYLDKRTGEFMTSTFDKLRLRAAAKAMNMDYQQVMDSVQAQAKNEFVRNRATQGWMSDEDKTLLSNIATVKDNQAKVSFIDANGRTQEKNVAEITATELKLIKMQNQSESDDVKDIATMLRGWDDSIMGFRKQLENTKAQAVEASGLGVKAKSMIQMMGESNAALNTIVGFMTILTAATLFNSIGNAGQFFSMGRGMRAEAVGNLGGKPVAGGPVGGTPPVMATGRPVVGGSVNSGGGKIYRTSKNAVYTQKPGETIWRDASGNPIKNQKQIDNLYNKSASKAGTATGSVPGGVGGTATGNVPTGGTGLTKTGQKLGLGSNNAGTFGSFTAADGKQHLITKNGEHLVRENGGKWMTSTGEAVAPSRQGGLTRAFKSGSNKLNPEIISAAEKNSLVKRPTALSKAVPKLKAGFTSTPKVAGLGMGLGIAGAVGNMLMAQGRASGKIKKGSFGDYAGSMASSAIEGAGMGSMFGPIGMAIGAIGGATVGLVNAGKRNLENKIAKSMGGEGLGVAEGRYTNHQLRQIKRYIESDGKEKLSDKLKDKMKASGDQHILEKFGDLDEIKGDKFSAKSANYENSSFGNAYINRLEVTGTNAIGQAAGGAVVNRGVPGVDTEHYMLAKNEVVLNPKQQANLLYNFANVRTGIGDAPVRRAAEGDVVGQQAPLTTNNIWNIHNPAERAKLLFSVANLKPTGIAALSINPLSSTSTTNIIGGSNRSVNRNTNNRSYVYGDVSTESVDKRRYRGGDRKSTSNVSSIRGVSNTYGGNVEGSNSDNRSYVYGDVANETVENRRYRGGDRSYVYGDVANETVDNRRYRGGDRRYGNTVTSGNRISTVYAPSVSRNLNNTSTSINGYNPSIDTSRSVIGGNNFSYLNPIQSTLNTTYGNVSSYKGGNSLGDVRNYYTSVVGAGRMDIPGIRNSNLGVSLAGTSENVGKVQPLSVTPKAEIAPRQVDIEKVLPKVEPSLPKVVEHKISDLKISLDVNWNSAGAQDFGRMLSEELRKNPLLLHNLANTIATQIGVNEDGGRVVKKFTL